MAIFEFDENKSVINQKKHGIDFVRAQALWNDAGLVEVQAKTQGEPRFLIIGLIDNKHWSAVVTRRDGAIRIISVRRARKEEVIIYEN